MHADYSRARKLKHLPKQEGLADPSSQFLFGSEYVITKYARKKKCMNEDYSRARKLKRLPKREHTDRFLVEMFHSSERFSSEVFQILFNFN